MANQTHVINAYQTDTQEALLFIPDISGFTHFVNNTEILHARHIIEELLEVIIDSNEIGLELSEIEGDAILFYRFGQAPTAAALLAQVQKMYVKFQAHLRRYETHRICQCGACASAFNLTLKFVAHFGAITTKQVKDNSKLFGKEVIVVHRLLKNEINNDEYVLVTDSLTRACKTWVDLPTVAWSNVQKGSSEYDYGTSKYCFLPLNPLMEHVPEPTVEDYTLPKATLNYFASEAVINAPIDLVFNVVSDISFRQNWQVYVDTSDELSGKISQQGIKHRCIVTGEKNPHRVVSHSYTRENDVIHFTDTNIKAGACCVYTLRKIGPGLTRITADNFMKPNRLKLLLFNLMMKKKLEALFEASWQNLDVYCKQLQNEGKDHTAQIVLLNKAA